MGRALPENLASLPDASHSSKAAVTAVLFSVSIMFVHIDLQALHRRGNCCGLSSPHEKDCNKQLTSKITQQLREAENHSHRRTLAQSVTCFAKLPLFWKKKSKDEASQLVKKPRDEWEPMQNTSNCTDSEKSSKHD